MPTYKAQDVSQIKPTSDQQICTVDKVMWCGATKWCSSIGKVTNKLRAHSDPSWLFLLGEDSHCFCSPRLPSPILKILCYLF